VTGQNKHTARECDDLTFSLVFELPGGWRSLKHG
jgi:hypothetical protein